jgi:short-subunit dehydrogenase
MKRALLSEQGGIGSAVARSLVDYELTLVGRDARTLQGLARGSSGR